MPSNAFMAAYHATGAAEHHTREECPNGRLIAPEDRVTGTGGLPQCRVCATTEETNRRALDYETPRFGKR